MEKLLMYAGCWLGIAAFILVIWYLFKKGAGRID